MLQAGQTGAWGLVPPGVDLAAVLVELRPSGSTDAERVSTTWTGPDGTYRLRGRVPATRPLLADERRHAADCALLAADVALARLEGRRLAADRVHEVIDGFDPASMKISFLYFGTRERLSVEDSDAGLVISSLPTGQSVTFPGVTKSELIPGLIEFHHDQVIEDNLEAPFGFAQDDVTLVDRTMLLTPAAPAGATTDGFQTSTGDMTGSSTGAARVARPRSVAPVSISSR